MTRDTVATLKNHMNDASAEYMGLPRAGYDGMEWGHLMLIERLLDATNGTLHSEIWPCEDERKQALQLIAEASYAFDKFLERFSFIGHDGPTGQETTERLESAKRWSESVFSTLPKTCGE